MREEALALLKKNSTVLPNGCHQYDKSLVLGSYGRVNVTKIVKFFGTPFAHKLAYFLKTGNQPRLRKICKTPMCVNPDHMEPYALNCKVPLGTYHTETYNYYNNGDYRFYNKFTRVRVLLDKKKTVVEKGKVFSIEYIPPFDEILKTYLPDIGVLCEGEEL